MYKWNLDDKKMYRFTFG